MSINVVVSVGYWLDTCVAYVDVIEMAYSNIVGDNL